LPFVWNMCVGVFLAVLYVYFCFVSCLHVVVCVFVLWVCCVFVLCVYFLCVVCMCDIFVVCVCVCGVWCVYVIFCVSVMFQFVLYDVVCFGCVVGCEYGLCVFVFVVVSFVWISVFGDCGIVRLCNLCVVFMCCANCVLFFCFCLFFLCYLVWCVW